MCLKTERTTLDRKCYEFITLKLKFTYKMESSDGQIFLDMLFTNNGNSTNSEWYKNR